MHQPWTAELAERFARFAAREAQGSSPLYERLCRDLAHAAPVRELYARVDARQRRPNLLLAAMHAVILAGADHDLAAYYPSVGGSRAPDDALVPTAVDFLATHRRRLHAWMTQRTTQTNEVRRSALLLCALNQISWRGPPALVDVGAAAGLNLLVDGYGYRFGQQQLNTAAPVRVDCTPVGAMPLPDLRLVPITERIGVDRSPLDLTDPEDVLWLRACIWPEHRHRRELLDAAIALTRCHPPPVIAADALELDEVAARLSADLHVVVFHCATLAYLPPPQRDAFAARLEAIAANRYLSWISIEGPFIPPYDRLDDTHPIGPIDDRAYFIVGLTEWPHRQRHDRLLARADPHGSWIQWLHGS